MADLNIIDNILESSKRLKSKEQMLGKGLNMPFNALNAGARKLMFSTQMDHRVELLNPEVPLISTGYENKFGEHTSSFIRSDGEYLVIAKIDKFAHLPGHHYYLILKKIDTDEYHVIEKINYEYLTESYGYLYNTNYLDNLKIGSVIKDGDVVKKSKSYDEYNNRMDGVNLITTYLSNEDTKEDGIVISESASKKLACSLIKNIQIVINDNDIPLNIYGDDTTYKTMPDIGEYIKNGILCATRREKKEESLFSQSFKRLQTLNISDDKILAKGQVIDIDIFCNNPEMLQGSYYSKQLKFYNDNKIRFMNEIVDTLAPIVEDQFNICSYDLQKLYYDSKKIVVEGKKYLKDKVFSNIIINIVTLEESIVTKGDKISNRYGGKGVISRVRPDDLMPMLETGERVELIFNSSGVINREIMGPMFETSLNHISNLLLHSMESIVDSDECNAIYIDLVKLVNPEQGKELEDFYNRLSPDEKDMLIDSAIMDQGMMLSLRPISDLISIDMLAAIYRRFPYIKQHKVVIPQRDSNGNIRYLETRRRLTCGRQYIYRLKQVAEEKFNATSLSSTDFKNENSKSSSKKSYKAPISKTPIRFGEMETGNLLHLGAENVVMNLLLYSASPKARRLAEELLTGDPFDINIELNDECDNRGVEILNAYMMTMGLRLNFVKTRRVKKSIFSKMKVISVPPKRTAIRFVSKEDKMVELLNNRPKSKSPIKFVPISIGRK